MDAFDPKPFVMRQGIIGWNGVLMEELRMDLPNVKNRIDPETEEMKMETDPHEVLNAIDLEQIHKKVHSFFCIFNLKLIQLTLGFIRNSLLRACLYIIHPRAIS